MFGTGVEFTAADTLVHSLAVLFHAALRSIGK
jgi:hypothetical protein